MPADRSSPHPRADLTAGLVVFLVALPLCLGIALASGAPLLSGVLAGIVGGVLVGALSGSHTSVAGPAAGLTAVVLAQINGLGFPAFLLVVVLAGVVQIALGLFRAGFIASFVPSAVIKGLLAAIGVILILKQIPHVLGHDPDPEGDMAFAQPDQQNTFTELAELLGDVQPGAAAVGLLSVALLVLWDRWKWLKGSPVPSALAVVLFGVGGKFLFDGVGQPWTIDPSHLVQVPVPDTPAGFLAFLQLPDFSQWRNPAVYAAALTLAAVASLETLLNLEAVDKLDPRRRASPPSRELVAQGVGNVASGLIGGLPVTSVIVRSSVNINAGARSKLSTVVHGLLLAGFVVLLPTWLNVIPLSCLAAILLVTGVKLASPKLVRQMWAQGKYQFVPFALTVAFIVFTDLLVGVLAGLAVSVGFILWSNARRPLRQTVEKHPAGEVVRIELANQVSFLQRAALDEALNAVPAGGHVLLDARSTDYIDPDILALIREFKDHGGPARGVEVGLLGFRKKYELTDQLGYPAATPKAVRDALTPAQVLQLLRDGNDRFRAGQRLTRDLARQVSATAAGQNPLAVVLSCIDSRAPIELLFDMGVGDLMVARIAGNVAGPKVIGSAEYACAVAGAKLVVVLGHTRCGAVTAAVDLLAAGERASRATGCEHLDPIVEELQLAVNVTEARAMAGEPAAARERFVDAAARRNVARAAGRMVGESGTLAGLVRDGRIAVVGAMYDVASGGIEFLPETVAGPVAPVVPAAAG